MSHFIELTEIIVVSDIGDRWSPKKLPDAIAPNAKYGSIPFVIAIGINNGTENDIVPVDVPHIVDIILHTIKNIIGKKLFSKFELKNNVINESINPVAFNMFDNIPENININKHMIIM